MTHDDRLDLLASCVAFAIAHLVVPLGQNRTPLAPTQMDWRTNFLIALEKCGYGSTGCELPVNNSEVERVSLRMGLDNIRFIGPKRVRKLVS